MLNILYHSSDVAMWGRCDSAGINGFAMAAWDVIWNNSNTNDKSNDEHTSKVTVVVILNGNKNGILKQLDICKCV